MSALQRFRAALGGYFALPCPLCGQEFYGFQHAQCGSIPVPECEGISKMVCPQCTREGRDDSDYGIRKYYERRATETQEGGQK